MRCTMRTSIYLIFAFALIGILTVGDAFSRGMRGGGGGGMRGGGASFRGGGGASHRSPSMGHRSTGSRSTAARSTSAARQARPSGGKAGARPAQPSRKPSTSQKRASRDKTAARPAKPPQKPTARPSQPTKGRPTQAQVKNFLDSPGKGGRGLSGKDLAKIGGGAAAGALGVEAARQLLAQKPGKPEQLPARPERPGRPGKPEQPIAGKPGAPGRPGQPGMRPERPSRPEQPIAGKPGAPGRPGQPGMRPERPARPGQPVARPPRPVHPIAKPPRHPGGPPLRPVHPIARPPYNRIPHHWWRWAGWGAAAGWIVGAHWSNPYYYGYGDNVYYEGDYVYIDGQPAATGEEYYDQARTIATSAPEVKATETKEWLPLGVFGLYQSDSQDSNMVLQLAMNKKGVLSGTYYNLATNTERPVSGLVDQKTQRAAWTFADGNNTDVIMETGLANLTEDQAPALVHFGKNKTEQWLMVRQPESK